jgi:hypothetical protein
VLFLGADDGFWTAKSTVERAQPWHPSATPKAENCTLSRTLAAP